ncbi:MAG: TrmO family methyltransferase [Elusimicrobiales bacterium]|nr:TrmO family methyltransferase [Elusimicrobiales bacterium]
MSSNPSIIQLTPVGVVRSTRKAVSDDNWDVENTYIELDATRFDNTALRGLENFSHAEIVFYMDKVNPDKIEYSSRHPRNNINWPKVGVFSQRGKNRPNQIGVTVCRVKAIDGLLLHLDGLDAVNDSFVLDIKPWVTEFGPRGKQYQPSWISELMANYWSAQSTESAETSK